MGYWGYPEYVSVAAKKAKAAKKLKQLRGENPGIKPIFIEGRTIAKTWWGKSWNLNLERYADYSNRIGRGRSYVRHGAVLDLRIDQGRVEALVQGSTSRPYSVIIKIKAVSDSIWREIKSACEGKLDSLQGLLAGKFPKALGEIFMARGEGLFPSPKEIEFECSCPDWAYMCKHVAAVLYGIGARLDEDPGLFFKLRKVKMDDLVTQAVKGKTRKLLEKAEKKSKRVIAESDLSKVFGIDLGEDTGIDTKKTTANKKPGSEKKPAKGKAAKPAAKSGKAGIAKRKPETKGDEKQKKTRKMSVKERLKKVGKEPAAKSPPLKKKKPKEAIDADLVLNIIKRSKKGVDVPTLGKRTGINTAKIRTIVYGAFKKGEIRRAGRGIYLKA